METKKYHYLSYVFSLLALLWFCVGYYTYGFYDRVFNPPLIPDLQPFNVFHEGVVLLLSGIGIVMGVIHIRRYKSWPAGFFISAIVFLIVGGATVS